MTEKLVYEMAHAGADLIELGIPFSDPMAEGPVIQAADVRALASGTTTDKIFDMVKESERNVMFLSHSTYVNPVFAYGPCGSCKTAKNRGGHLSYPTFLMRKEMKLSLIARNRAYIHINDSSDFKGSYKQYRCRR